MPMRKGKAPESILKHPDQARAAKENQSSAAGPSAPASRITVSTPIITASTNRDITTAAVKKTSASDTSGPQYYKGNLTDLRRILHSSLAKGNPKRTL
jgi:hypothetical protein